VQFTPVNVLQNFAWFSGNLEKWEIFAIANPVAPW